MIEEEMIGRDDKDNRGRDNREIGDREMIEQGR